MPPNILLIGASGYIGGTTLSTLLEKHPSWTLTAIVRNEDQASTIQNAFPNTPLTTVIGSLDSADVLAAEASKASIIVQLANGDHDAGTDALLAAIGSTATPESRKYYIHLSGAATVLDLSLAPGLPPSRGWNDTVDLPAILDLPPTQIHAAIEQRIVSFGDQNAKRGVRTAIVSPPAVIGVGTGPIRQGVAYHVNLILQRKKGFVVGKGLNRFAMAHVRDVADGIVTLIEAAGEELVAQSDSAPPKADWNSLGYYFLTSGWTNPDKTTYVRAILSILKDKSIFLEDSLDQLTVEESSLLHPFGPIIFGASLEIEGKRIQHRVGWRSSFTHWEEALKEEVKAELLRQARGEKLSIGFGRE